MALTLTQTLTGTKSDGTPSEIVYPCAVQGLPRRAIGLAGDNLTVLVDAVAGENVWPPAEWDLTKRIVLSFGFLGEPPDADELVTLDLFLEQDTPVAFGVDDGTPGALGGSGTSTAQRRSLLLTTLMGVYEDGRGGRLTVGTLNPLGEDGLVDTAHADYRPHSDLVGLCISAMGFTGGDVDADIDDMDAPGPLDWGNADPRHELESLLARAGYAAVISYSGTNLSVFRLPKAGEDLAAPAWVAAGAEPHAFTNARAVRGTTVIVTSGRTRTTEATWREMQDLEWVWRDPKTGRWLNGAETWDLYPGETRPDDLSAFQKGPGTTPASRARFNRVFRAVRVRDAYDFARTRRLTALPGIAFDGEGRQVRSGAVVEAQCVSTQASGLLANEPEVLTAHARLDGARVHGADGVIELPSHGVHYVRVGPGTTGNHSHAFALGPTMLRVAFAHEANNGVFADDYYMSAWRGTVDGTSGRVVVARLTGEAMDAALADPMAVTLRCEWLRRLVEVSRAGERTPLNDAALDAAAESMALARAAGDLAESGVVEVRGIVDKIPGVDWPAATAIAWDLARRVTIVTVNSHEVPQGFWDAQQAEVHRSVAAGLSRFTTPGSSAGDADARQASAPGSGAPAWMGSSGGGAGSISGAGRRGAEAAVGPALAGDGAAPSARDATGAGSMIWARITGSTPLGPNRWEYDWEEVAPLDDASGWAPSNSVLRRTSGFNGRARNLLEVANGSSGVQGNGVDVANLIGTFALRPVATGTVHLMHGPTGSVVSPHWWFGSPNGVDGACQ